MKHLIKRIEKQAPQNALLYLMRLRMYGTAGCPARAAMKTRSFIKFMIIGLIWIMSATAGYAYNVVPSTWPDPNCPPYPEFRILVLYSNTVEPDHVAFKQTALDFFKVLQEGREFDMDTSADMQSLVTKKLSDYSLIIMLNDFPHSDDQRKAFKDYMEHGGGWLGFHVAGYNDRTTHWPWFVHFLGGAVFYTNSWPPVPAKLLVDLPGHPVTRTLPASFMSPSNEWYQWKPSPRLDSNVQVLVSLSEENYPLGLKDILCSGDNPVVWTNTAYRMVYMNMGHGSAIFTDATQNKLIINAFRWLVSRDPKGNVFN